MMSWCPESPRWLINRGQEDKALQILAHYHANGNGQDEFVQLEYTEIRAALAIEKEAEANTWLDFLRTKGNRKRIGIITAIGFFSQWSGNGLISYYLYQVMNNISITSPQTQLGVNGGLKTWGLIVNITMSSLTELEDARSTSFRRSARCSHLQFGQSLLPDMPFILSMASAAHSFS
jgi:hypothetical protein